MATNHIHQKMNMSGAPAMLNEEELLAVMVTIVKRALAQDAENCEEGEKCESQSMVE